MLTFIFVLAVILFVLAYFIYGRFLDRRFNISDENPTPSHTDYDGIDRVPAKKPVNGWLLGAGAVIVLVILFIISKGVLGSKDTSTAAGGDLVISKNEITATAKFFPYKAGSTKMEVLALKAPDGTIRTAFNTCQVCYSSGRGYYKQEGDELVCQNCGNRFKASQVEKIKGGCNPVPIMKDNKTEDGTNITISKDFLVQNKELFSNWKK
jgi:hypothetical protein